MTSPQFAGSGLYFDAGKETLLEDFLRNSKVMDLSKGSNGLTMLAELNDDAVSPYRSLDARKFAQPVKKLLLKFCYMAKDDAGFVGLNPLKTEAFEMEVNAQTEVFLKSNRYLEPLCPAIVFAGIFNQHQSPLLKICVERQQQKKNWYLSAIERVVYEREGQFGIIAMEFAEGFTTLLHYEMKHSGKTARLFVLAALLRMAKETGYNHGDFHRNNFMVRATRNPDYFGVLVIDFGMVQKMSREQQRVFDQLFLDKKFDEALLYLCTAFFRRDGYTMEHESYDMVCKSVSSSGFDTSAAFNTALSAVLTTVMDREVTNTRRMEVRRETNPRVPLLPLGTNMRNQMFSGIDSSSLPLENAAGLAPTLDITQEALRSKLEQAAKIASADNYLFSKAVMQAYGYAKEKRRLRELFFSSILYCCMVCQGMLQPNSSKPLTMRGMGKEIVSAMDTIGNCRWNISTPSFLDNLSSSGIAALRALTVGEAIQLLAENSTYTDPVAVAMKLNQDGEDLPKKNKGMLSQMRQGVRQLLNIPKQPKFSYEFPFAEEAEVGGKRRIRSTRKSTTRRSRRRRGTLRGSKVRLPYRI